MSLAVVFVTADDDVIKTVSERRGSLVPESMRANAFSALDGEEVFLSAFKARRGTTVPDLLAHIGEYSGADISGLLLLTDGQIPQLVERLGDIFFVNRFVPPTHNQKTANLLTASLAKALRAFRHLKTRFDDRKYQQVLRLPLRNFAAPEIGAMQRICRDAMNQENFGRELDWFLRDFRNDRQKPKKASDSPVTYFVDEDGKHFHLGHEQHARAETATPPHDALCILANAFRFGCAFDGERHFNVSKDRNAPLLGQYSDCHGELRPGRGAQHLNMFTNDFF